LINGLLIIGVAAAPFSIVVVVVKAGWKGLLHLMGICLCV
jgi:hypothetical protein